MAFGETYNVDTPPEHAEAPSLGNDRIRELKEANRERLDVDHYYPEDTPTAGLCDATDTGEHRQATLRERADPGAVDEDKIVVYAKEANNVAEDDLTAALVACDEDEAVKQLTIRSGDDLCLNLEGKDLTAGVLLITDQTSIDVVAGKLTLIAGAAGIGVMAAHLATDPGDFCDDVTLEIDEDDGLQIKDGYLEARLGQADQEVGTTDISNVTADWADMTDMEIAITPAGGSVLIQFAASVRMPQETHGAVRITIDTVEVVATKFSGGADAGTYEHAVALHWLAEGLDATEHTIKVQWRDIAGTVYQDGTSYKRVLTVQEIPS